ncbi:hypothetical protein CI610_02607 [invertebrate metagenome]|uniref:Mobile element protein n=1 Tax=invertebrate metagenome TaxID=1711999 RepID=A0A2H9T5I5_9ZZZZ
MIYQLVYDADKTYDSDLYWHLRVARNPIASAEATTAGAVMSRLNNRPRKTKGCRSPNELFIGQRMDLLAV